ncbi:hypothetical protein D3C87_256840 [compost metagenome]
MLRQKNQSLVLSQLLPFRQAIGYKDLCASGLHLHHQQISLRGSEDQIDFGIGSFKSLSEEMITFALIMSNDFSFALQAALMGPGAF